MLLAAALLGASAQAVSGTLPWSALGTARPALHLSATYPGPDGKPAALDFWRGADGSVVRRTAGKSELRLTPAVDGEDAYQLRNLTRRVAYDVHRTNLYRVGILTDRWSVQHLLDKPTTAYTLQDLRQSATVAGQPCAWFRLTPKGLAPTDLCWSARLGVPLSLKAAGKTLLTVTAVQTAGVKLPPAALLAGWNEFNADEDIAPD